VNSNVGYSSVHCPLTLPADDTNEAVGSISNVTVHYKTAVQNQYPICQLSWRDRFSYFDGRADEYWSPAFFHSDFTEYVYLGSANTRLPVGASVFCDLPPGMTLQGVTAQVGVAEVSGGG